MTGTNQPKLNLYHSNPSLCSQMVRVALAEKGLEYEARQVLLCDQHDEAENIQPWFLEINPTAVVPVLMVDGEMIRDSSYIIEMLDGMGSPGSTRIWPQDEADKQELRRWIEDTGLPDSARMGKTLGTAVTMLSIPALSHLIKGLKLRSVFNILRRHPRRDRAWTYASVYFTPLAKNLPLLAYKGFVKGIIEVESMLKDGRDYLLGDFSHADINLMCVFHRIVFLRLGGILEMSELPNVAAFWGRLKSRESYKSGVLDFMQDADFEVQQAVFGDAWSPHLQPLQQSIRETLAAQNQ